jgi:hypothetical protein
VQVRGDLQLRLEQHLLTRAIEFRKIVIQAELADRAQLWIARQPIEPLAQFDQVVRAMRFEKYRMQPQRRRQSRVGLDAVPHALPVVALHGKHHHALDAHRLGLIQQLRAVNVEVGKVQVGMSIDQRHRRHAQASAMRCLKVRAMACTPGS